ncbi:MAG TPA: nucleotide exchange factor GrpE [Pyrinomonadaceae bacterium]|jgi:molecular chaperone GrpE
MTTTPQDETNRAQARLDEMARLLEEIADDNTAVAGSIGRVLDAQEALRAEVARGLDQLREDFAGALTYRVLKDLCGELIRPLAAMERMVAGADFADPAQIREHVESLVVTLQSVLARLGAEKISVAPGAAQFDPAAHRCVRLLAPAESPFPSAPPRTVVRVVEDGYTLAGRLLAPAQVEVQAEQ